MNRVKKLILIHILLITLIFSSSTLSIAAQARNIIFMIGGGMGPAHIHTTWLYATRDLGKNLIMTEIMDKGRTAYMINDTADSTVTESAAAATQMATGVKVLARAIGIGPDGRALKTILELAKEKGKATGLVTTFMSMTEEKPEWKLSGDCVEGYTSPPVCPAYWGSPFPKDLHEGKSQCEGAWSFNIREGYHRDINRPEGMLWFQFTNRIS